MNTPGYESLAAVLQRAYDQAASGKGAERHACSRPFTEQPMQSISDLLGSHTGLLYQAMKKIQESERMDIDAATRELLGAINYVAGAIIFIEARRPEIKAIDWAGIEQAQNVGKMAMAARKVNPLNTVADEPRSLLSAEQYILAQRNLHQQVNDLVSRRCSSAHTAWVCCDIGLHIPLSDPCPRCGKQASDIASEGVPFAHWLCHHGLPGVPGKPIPIGEACPTCFAVHN